MSITLYIKTTTGDIMNQSKPQETGYESRTRMNIKRLAIWGIAWMGTSLLMASGPLFLWHKALVLTLLAVGLNLCVGVRWILATKKYVEQQDELQRKVYLNALGITAGVAPIGGIPFSALDAFHMIPLHADIAHLLMLMALTFVVSVVYGMWRYR
jgi:hypothetical protein